MWDVVEGCFSGISAPMTRREGIRSRNVILRASTSHVLLKHTHSHTRARVRVRTHTEQRDLPFVFI